MLFKPCLLITFFIVAAYCYGYDGLDQSDNGVDEVGDPADEYVADERERKLREKCLAHGGESAYEDVKNAKEEMLTCVKPLFNPGKMLIEYGWSESHGALNKFFKKYCDKAPRIRRCLVPYIITLKRCLSEIERKTARAALQVFKNFVKFSCFKDGRKIAKFIDRGGLQCLQIHSEKITRCYVGANSPTRTPVIGPNTMSKDPEHIARINFKKNCHKISSVRECVVSEMKFCRNFKIAKTMEAFFKFVLKDIPCRTKH